MSDHGLFTVREEDEDKKPNVRRASQVSMNQDIGSLMQGVEETVRRRESSVSQYPLGSSSALSRMTSVGSEESDQTDCDNGMLQQAKLLTSPQGKPKGGHKKKLGISWKPKDGKKRNDSKDKNVRLTSVKPLESSNEDEDEENENTKLRPYNTSESETQSPSIKFSEKPKFFCGDDISEHHEVFVDMEELQDMDSDGPVWKETARWMKYEEDFENDAEKWGRAHISSLNFTALVELRHGLQTGVLLLDFVVTTFENMVETLSKRICSHYDLSPEVEQRFKQTMLLRHRHADDNHGRRMSKTASLAAISSFIARRRQSFATLQRNTDKEVPLDVEKLDLESLRRPSTSHSFFGSHDQEHEGMTDSDRIVTKAMPKDSETFDVLCGRTSWLEEPIWAFVRFQKKKDFGNKTSLPFPLRFMFLILVPKDSLLDPKEIGRSIATVMSNKEFHDEAYRVQSPGQLLDAYSVFLSECFVLQPGKWNKKTLLPLLDAQAALRKKEKEAIEEKKRITKEQEVPSGKKPTNPLVRTRRCFGGLVKDVKRRYPQYWSDIRDAVNFKCIAAIIFIYFACLAPAVTFGGLLGDKVDNWMGASELLLGSAINGVLFSLLAGQPLLIVGTSGPIVVYEEVLYTVCQSMGLDYMSFRFWTGAWVTIITLVVVAAEGSCLAKFFSRFVEEIFAFLIGLIFVLECFLKLQGIFKEHPLLPEYPGNDIENATLSLGNSTFLTSPMTTISPSISAQPNTALLSLILMCGTFVIAWSLKSFRNSVYLSRTIRRSIGDFGVPIAIIVMVLVDLFILEDSYTQKLNVPGGVRPTRQDRGWVINPLGEKMPLPWWAMLLAILPAALVFILVFMETTITNLIVGKPERNLKKGTGPHLDMTIVGFTYVLNSALGLPWVTAVAVRSITHVNALSIFSSNLAPGESPKLEGVVEQRVTGFIVSCLIGVSVFLTIALQEIPMAVLFGVFLYMGISSLSGLQLVDRTLLFFMPLKHYPNVAYARQVRRRFLHLYTAIQILCLSVLVVVKMTMASIGFPLFLIALVPVRWLILPKIFDQKDLAKLDSDDSKDDLYEDEDPDFCTEAHMPL